jgi:hypothetical protein
MMVASAWLTAHSARADETPLVVAGALLESRARPLEPVIAPVIALRVPVLESSTLVLSQLGWTSGIALTTQQRPNMALRSSLELTPLAAHLSHDVYDEQGHPLPEAEIDDTSLRATSGVEWSEGPARLRVHGVLNKEWLGNADTATAKAFRFLYVGFESALTLEHLRSEEPLRSRIDGARLQLRGQALQGARSWTELEASLELGHRHGALFVTARAAAFQSLRALANPHPNPLAGKVGFDLKRRGEGDAWIPAEPRKPGLPVEFEDNSDFVVEIFNRTSRQIFPYLLDLGIGGRGCLIYPFPGAREPLAKRHPKLLGDRGGEELTFFVPDIFPYHDPGSSPAAGLQMLKLLVTTEEIDLRPLFQPSYRSRPDWRAEVGQSALGRMLARLCLGDSMRDVRTGWSTENVTWTTHEVPVLLRRSDRGDAGEVGRAS